MARSLWRAYNLITSGDGWSLAILTWHLTRLAGDLAMMRTTWIAALVLMLAASTAGVRLRIV